MPQKEESHAGLYEMKTWAPTNRLKGLRKGHKPLRREVHDLYGIYLVGTRDAGTEPSITEFGAWLLGNDPNNDRAGYSSMPPAEVFW